MNPNVLISLKATKHCADAPSLRKSFPPGIFGNRRGNVLFIPGSCGSAGSVPEYLTANPSTNLTFFSNTSTGRGHVTNALLTALVEAKAGAEFKKILEDNAGFIEKNGGDVKTIRVFSPGEALLAYVLQPASPVV